MALAPALLATLGYGGGASGGAPARRARLRGGRKLEQAEERRAERQLRLYHQARRRPHYLAEMGPRRRRISAVTLTQSISAPTKYDAKEPYESSQKC